MFLVGEMRSVVWAYSTVSAVCQAPILSCGMDLGSTHPEEHSTSRMEPTGGIELCLVLRFKKSALSSRAVFSAME